MAKTAMNYKIPEDITSITVNFFTPDLPPPFSYAYNLKAIFSKDNLAMDFSLTYTGRDEIEEEEILAEGFSLNDDYNLNISLPKAWVDAFHEQIEKTSWRKNKQNTPLNIIIAGHSENDTFEATPSDLSSWEYFLQELMQGIFEAGKREHPLEVQYKEINNSQPDLTAILQASFQNRTAAITYKKDSGQPKKVNLAWKGLKKLLKAIFMPDYHPDLGQEQTPSKTGKYINPGDGKWYAFGKAMTNPGKEIDSLAILEKQFKEGLNPGKRL